MLLIPEGRDISDRINAKSALLDLQLEQTAAPEFLQLIEESQSRIRAIALIHEQLYTAPKLDRIKLSDYIQSLVSYLEKSFIPSHKQIKITF